jgi:magnesium chelatase family protein
MDRLDLHLEVPPVQYKDLTSEKKGAGSQEILERVNRARRIQAERFRGKGLYTNAGMGSRHIRTYCVIDEASGDLLERAMDRFGLSARAHARIMKIARTIADLDESPHIQSAHVAEAIQYRTLDRKLNW